MQLQLEANESLATQAFTLSNLVVFSCKIPAELQFSAAPDSFQTELLGMLSTRCRYLQRLSIDMDDESSVLGILQLSFPELVELRLYTPAEITTEIMDTFLRRHPGLQHLGLSRVAPTRLALNDTSIAGLRTLRVAGQLTAIVVLGTQSLRFMKNVGALLASERSTYRLISQTPTLESVELVVPFPSSSIPNVISHMDYMSHIRKLRLNVSLNAENVSDLQVF